MKRKSRNCSRCNRKIALAARFVCCSVFSYIFFVRFQGTARRKKKVVHKTAATDEKKLQSNLKKLSVTNIPGIEEVCSYLWTLLRTTYSGEHDQRRWYGH